MPMTTTRAKVPDRAAPPSSIARQLASLTLLLLVTLGLPTAWGETVKPGSRVADFDLERLGGGTLSLSEVADRSSLVLVFFRGVW